MISVKPEQQTGSPAAIVVGGDANALSVARCLHAAGISVHALCRPGSRIRYSRTCHWIDLTEGDGGPDDWGAFLLGPHSDHLRGAVLLACSDEAIEMIIAHRPQLADKFVIEEGDGEMRLSMLDKLRTYEKSAEADIPTPKYWRVWSVSDLDGLKNALIFPLIIKPLFSHHTRRIWKNRKYLAVENYEDLHRNFTELQHHGIEFLLMEFIPGGDDLLCSYYTYIDENGSPLFHFTKRVFRRYPENMGEGCYHVTDWSPDVRDMGLKFFRHVKLRGLGNVEFKRDPRDGKLKIIECNARFTAANCLVKAAGLDLALLTYNKLTGRPLPTVDSYRSGQTLWLPIQDFLAYRELKRKGKITFLGWLGSIMRSQQFQFFSWTDPLPSVVGTWRIFNRLILRRRTQPVSTATALR
ncbi:MAG: carboxylate--amine ligase [Alphaproteobacteria bacterium]